MEAGQNHDAAGAWASAKPPVTVVVRTIGRPTVPKPLDTFPAQTDGNIEVERARWEAEPHRWAPAHRGQRRLCA